MIYGIGTDLVAVARMTDLHARYGDRFAERLLADAERTEYDQAQDKDRFLAKRFAAKEAFAKAVGTGLRSPVHLTNICVVHGSAPEAVRVGAKRRTSPVTPEPVGLDSGEAQS